MGIIPLETINMKSKGTDILHDSEGKGFLGCIAVIVLIAAMIFIGVKLGPIYYSNYQFEEALKTVTSRAGARFISNEKIIEDILSLAGEKNINLKEENIKIERYAGQVHIEVRYVVPVDLLVMHKKLEFQIKASSFTAT